MPVAFDAEPIAQRIQRQHKVAANGCWEWTGHINRLGYGCFRVGSRRDGTRRGALAHRCSWEVARGRIPDGLFVCHHCDNRKCINPDHLFLGTFQDNIDDREQKGRNNPPRGEHHSRAKLTIPLVARARLMYLEGREFVEIAQLLGYTPKTIRRAITGKLWAHVVDPKPVPSRGRGPRRQARIHREHA